MLKKIMRFAVLLLPILGASTPACAQRSSSAVLTIVGTQPGNVAGSITITINGEYQTVPFGAFSTASSIASGFGAEFSQAPFSTAPPLCTLGICAKSDGAKIVIQLEGPATFQPVTWSATPGSPFSVDTSQWPGTGTQTPFSMTLSCSPGSVAIGNSTTCRAILPAGTSGTVNFTIDGSPWQSSVSIDTNGTAIATGGLSGAAVGEHLVEAQYTSSTGVPSSALTNVEVFQSTIPPTGIYSYYIQTQSGQSGYAPNGNIVAYTDSVNGTWMLGYDSLNRITSSTQNLSGPTQYECWSYDSFGNRTIQASASQAPTTGCQPASGTASYYATLMQFADGSNRITGRGHENQTGTVQPVAAPIYDNDNNTTGNITGDLTYSYVYNAQGDICAAHTASGMTGYIYDASGHRVAKGTITSMTCDPSSNGFVPTNVYMLGSDGETMTEVDGGSWVSTHVRGGGEELATYDNRGVHFQVHDWLGTRRMQTNSSGVPEDYCNSQPFGDGENCNNSVFDATNYFFTGKERDTESGLDYFGARYYASTMGRFMSPDSPGFAHLSNPQAWNLYSYTYNNPITSIDPDGHDVACTYNISQCVADANTATGANGQVVANTTVTHHSALFGLIQWDTSVTKLGISGDEASFRALGQNASRLADLIDNHSFTLEVRYGPDSNNPGGSDSFLPSQGYSPLSIIDPRHSSSVHDPDALDQNIPQANTAEEFGHEVLGHEWGELINGDAAGSKMGNPLFPFAPTTRANMRDSITGENAVRKLDPTRGQKAINSHHNYPDAPSDGFKK